LDREESPDSGVQGGFGREIFGWSGWDEWRVVGEDEEDAFRWCLYVDGAEFSDGIFNIAGCSILTITDDVSKDWIVRSTYEYWKLVPVKCMCGGGWISSFESEFLAGLRANCLIFLISEDNRVFLSV
jgi:hypothetical protein